VLGKAAVIFLICVLTFWAYSEVRHHQFLNFDDNEYVTENAPVMNGLTLENLWWAFSFTGVSYWHPLSWLSHMADCQLFGLNSGAHHLMNLALHIANALLLFLILSRMTGSLGKPALAALLFALHPVNVESVAWVTERKTVLSAFFFLAALLAFTRYAERKSKGSYVLSLGLYGLGLLSKPSILVFPLLLLILDFWPLRRFSMGMPPALGSPSVAPHPALAPAAGPPSGIGRLLVEKIPFLLLSLLAYALSFLSLDRFHVVITADLIPLVLRIENLFVSIPRYLWSMVWPVELSIFYPFPKAVPLWLFLPSLLAVLLATALALLVRNKRPWITAGWLWFLAALAPVSGLVQAGLWPAMANRFLYIPMIGLLLLLVWEGDARVQGGGRRAALLKAILGTAVALYLGSLTRLQSIYYSNSYALFTRAAEVTGDNFVASNNIGNALATLNRIDEAGPHFARAMALNPRYDDAIFNYGLYLAKKGRPAEAMDHFSRVIELSPRFLAAHVNLAILHFHGGDKGKAEQLLLTALSIDPQEAHAHNNLGIIRAGQGRTEEALRHYRLAVRYRPGLVQARVNLAEAYEKAGSFREAIAEYEALVSKAPEQQSALHYRIAGLHARLGNLRECEEHLELALGRDRNLLARLESDDRFNDFRQNSRYDKLKEKFRNRPAGGGQEDDGP
jgi:tetratricopeptide (TPR) repeat protein